MSSSTSSDKLLQWSIGQTDHFDYFVFLFHHIGPTQTFTGVRDAVPASWQHLQNHHCWCNDCSRRVTELVVFNLGLKIVSIAWQTSEIADMQLTCNEKQQHQFSKSFKPHTWTAMKKIQFNFQKNIHHKIIIADKPGRMNTKFPNFTLHHRLLIKHDIY